LAGNFGSCRTVGSPAAVLKTKGGLRMKLRIFVFLAAAAMLPVSGCTSIARQLSAQRLVFDESLSPEESTVVAFEETIYVKEYNGIAVEDSWYKNGGRRINTITLPAGEATIVFDFALSVSQDNRTYSVSHDDIELRFNFEAEKEYTVGAYTNEEGFILVKIEYGVAVWDQAVTNNPGGVNINNRIKTWEFGTF
jgi:hypothetical protein